jgi:hypothetical protein
MTKEIGLLLGIPHTPDMTVEDYVRKVKQALGVPLEQVTSTPDRTRRLRDISAIPGR